MRDESLGATSTVAGMNPLGSVERSPHVDALSFERQRKYPPLDFEPIAYAVDGTLLSIVTSVMNVCGSARSNVQASPWPELTPPKTPATMVPSPVTVMPGSRPLP